MPAATAYFTKQDLKNTKFASINTVTDTLQDNANEYQGVLQLIELNLYHIRQELHINCVNYEKNKQATLQSISDELSVTLMPENH